MDHYLKIAEMKAAGGNSVLKTVVGSCICLCMWEKEKHIGGMVHIMMPKYKKSDPNTAKYADTAVKALFKLMIKKGCKKENIKATIAGGANMFGFNKENDIKTVGSQNEEIVKKELKELQIKIVREETGGNSGRHIDFLCQTGEVKIKTVGGFTKINLELAK